MLPKNEHQTQTVIEILKNVIDWNLQKNVAESAVDKVLTNRIHVYCELYIRNLLYQYEKQRLLGGQNGS